MMKKAKVKGFDCKSVKGLIVTISQEEPFSWLFVMNHNEIADPIQVGPNRNLKRQK